MISAMTSFCWLGVAVMLFLHLVNCNFRRRKLTAFALSMLAMIAHWVAVAPWIGELTPGPVHVVLGATMLAVLAMRHKQCDQRHD